MFDVSFGEMMVVGVVALVVIGPERLPKVARTVGSFIGKAQRYATQVRNDINAQIELEELRKTQQDIRDAAQQFEQSINKEIHAAEAEVAQIHQQVEEIRAELAHSETIPAEHATADIATEPSGDLFGDTPTAETLSLATDEPVDAEELEFRNRQLELFGLPPPSTPSPPYKAG